MVLNAVSSSTVFHVAIILNLANKRAALMFEFFFIVIQLSTHGTVYLILYSLHHRVIILEGNFVRLILISDYYRMILFLSLCLFFRYCIVFYMYFICVLTAYQWPSGALLLFEIK